MYEFVKRTTDLVFSLALILVFAPLLILISILIKLESPGPVLFRQTRIGRNGHPFDAYRFRTMKVATDEAREKEYLSGLLLRKTPLGSDDTIFNILAYPRLTRVGRILRKFNLDELPQLLNVLKGDMSLVGPHASLSYELGQYTEWHKQRLAARPGLTGLAQIAGRSQLGFDDMVKLDIEYIRRKSLILDWEIIVGTVPAVLFGRGAY